MSGSDFMKPMTNSDTDLRYKNGGISQVRIKTDITQGNLFIPQDKTNEVLSDLVSAIHDVLKKHGSTP